MSQDQFENYIRRQFADHSTALDAERLWQSIQARQQPRRRIVGWLAGCVLLGLGLAAYVLAAGAGLKNKVQPETVGKRAIAAAHTAVVAPRMPIAASAPAPDATAARLASSLVGLAASSLPTSAAPAGVSAADHPANPFSVQLTAATASSQTNLYRSEDAVSATVATTPVWPHVMSQPSDKPSLESASLAAAALPHAVARPSDEPPVSLDAPALPHAEARLASESSSESVSLATASLPGLLQAADSELPAAAEEPSYRKRLSGWFIGIGGSTYNPLRSLSSSDPESELLAEAIRRTEKPLEVVGAELQLGRYLRPGWSVQTGIAAQQQTERFEWTFEQLVVDTVIGVQSIIIDTNGDSTIITGPIARYQQLSRFKRTFNRYTFIDIPLLSSYEFGEGALKFSVSGGAIINLTMQTSGDRLSAQAQPVALEEATAFRMRAGLSFQAGMGASWELHPRWRVNGQLAMRYFPWTITEGDSQLRQQYQWLGAQLGLRYLL